MRTARLLLLCFACAAAGCGEDAPAPPTGPTTDTTVARTELFQGTIAPGGTAFYSFSVLADRNVAMTLAGLIDAAGRPLDVPVTLGFGIPQGTGCGVTRSVVTTPALQAQIVHGTPPGTYCVNITGTSGLAATTTFTIRIRQEPSTPPTAAPGTVMFESQLAVGGSSTRTFNASQSGTITVSLEGLGGSGARVGLGLGLPRDTGIGCIATRAVEVTSGSGPHISLPADVGFYCVTIFDIGTLTSSVPFSIRVGHP